MSQTAPLCLDQLPEASSICLIIDFCLGEPHPGPEPGLGAALCEIQDHERLLHIVSFCQQQQLPVDALLLRNLHRHPCSPWWLARLMLRLRCAAGTIPVYLDTRGLSTRQRQIMLGAIASLDSMALRG